MDKRQWGPYKQGTYLSGHRFCEKYSDREIKPFSQNSNGTNLDVNRKVGFFIASALPSADVYDIPETNQTLICGPYYGVVEEFAKHTQSSLQFYHLNLESVEQAATLLFEEGIDLGANPIPLSDTALAYEVSVSRWVCFVETDVIISKKIILKPNLFTLIDVFDRNVWLTNLAMLLFIAASTHLASIENWKMKASLDFLKKLLLFTTSLFYDVPYRYVSRVFLTTWIPMIFILRFFYCSELTNVLMIPQPVLQVNGINDLVQKYPFNTWDVYTLRESSDDLHISKLIEKSRHKRLDLLITSNSEPVRDMLRNVANGNGAFVFHGDIIKYIATHLMARDSDPSSLHLGKEGAVSSIMYMVYGFYAQEWVKQGMNLIIGRLVEFGLINQWTRENEIKLDQILYGHLKSSVERQVYFQSFPVRSVVGILIILFLLTFGLGFITLSFELINALH